MQPAVADAELARLLAEADFQDRLARRLVDDWRSERSLAAAGAVKTEPDTELSAREQVEIVAWRMILEADALIARMDPEGKAAAIYEKVVRLFPETTPRWRPASAWDPGRDSKSLQAHHEASAMRTTNAVLAILIVCLSFAHGPSLFAQERAKDGKPEAKADEPNTEKPADSQNRSRATLLVTVAPESNLAHPGILLQLAADPKLVRAAIKKYEEGDQGPLQRVAPRFTSTKLSPCRRESRWCTSKRG